MKWADRPEWSDEMATVVDAHLRAAHQRQAPYYSSWMWGELKLPGYRD